MARNRTDSSSGKATLIVVQQTLNVSTPCVTIIDDEPLAQDVLVRAAVSWQYQCQTAASAEAALNLLQDNLTPIVVTDLRMPGRGGVWLVQEIRKRWPEVRVIVLTAAHDTDAAQQCLQAGAHHYFLKPIKLDEFHHVLETTWHTYLSRRQENHHRSQLERAVRRQTRRVRKTFLSGIESLVRALEERDLYTAGHSLRVRKFALMLADELRLNEKDRKRLSLAAKLHDIGKVGVPETILLKKGSLTEAEMNVVREHPVMGERILRPIVRQREVLSGIRHHHERYDGSGYPDGLRGERIPLLARLITIPDFYDAVTSDRAYRAALSQEEALELLAKGAGTQFDGPFVEAFLRIFSRSRS